MLFDESKSNPSQRNILWFLDCFSCCRLPIECILDDTLFVFGQFNVHLGGNGDQLSSGGSTALQRLMADVEMEVNAFRNAAYGVYYCMAWACKLHQKPARETGALPDKCVCVLHMLIRSTGCLPLV